MLGSRRREGQEASFISPALAHIKISQSDSSYIIFDAGMILIPSKTQAHKLFGPDQGCHLLQDMVGDQATRRVYAKRSKRQNRQSTSRDNTSNLPQYPSCRDLCPGLHRVLLLIHLVHRVHPCYLFARGSPSSL